jgi:hypothetical protein
MKVAEFFRELERSIMTRASNFLLTYPLSRPIDENKWQLLQFMIALLNTNLEAAYDFDRAYSSRH